MAITSSEQAAAMNQRQRLDEYQVQRVVDWFVSGMSVDEVHAEVSADDGFEDYSRGTVANWQTRFKDRILAGKRARAVELSHILMARQEARIDVYSDELMASHALFRAQFQQCWMPNPHTGAPEFIGTWEGARMLKIYAEMVARMGRLIAEEKGDLRLPPDPGAGPITYSIPGLDLQAIADGWQQAGNAAAQEFESPPEPAPEPKAVDPRHEEWALGKDEYRRRVREGEPMPKPVVERVNPPDPQYQPDPNPLPTDTRKVPSFRTL
jgi:hypothetical protein